MTERTCEFGLLVLSVLQKYSKQEPARVCVCVCPCTRTHARLSLPVQLGWWGWEKVISVPILLSSCTVEKGSHGHWNHATSFGSDRVPCRAPAPCHDLRQRTAFLGLDSH